MDDSQEKIVGGAFQVARKLFNSEAWLEKPASWTKIWIYILGNVNHKKRGTFERSEGFFNWEELTRTQRLGKDITISNIKSFMTFASGSNLLTTTRTTRGMRLKVLNYEKYQNLDNYTTTSKTTSEQRVNNDRTTTIHKNEKNYKNEKNTRTGFSSYKDDPKFMSFYEVYPKKKDPHSAYKEFLKIKDIDKILPTILKDVESKKQTEDWQKENGRFILYPVRYLNKRRWEDEEELTEEQKLWMK